MPFCMYCGEALPSRAHFCFMCGKPVEQAANSTDVQRFSLNQHKPAGQGERTYKCPSCGSVISKLDAVCEYCGAQIVDREASSAVSRFASELYLIEAQGVDYSAQPRQPRSTFLGMELFPQEAMDKAYGNRVFERKLSLIRSFPIPNTVEEISEFIMLAAANIDVRFGKNSLGNKVYGNPGSTYYTDITLAKAWIAKMQQAYQKAEISFPNDPIFPKIREIYVDKMTELGYKV